jgi:glucose/arabinose dehydrogenase
MRRIVALALALAALVAVAASRAEQAPSYRFRSVLSAQFALHLAAPRSAADKLYVAEQDGRVRVAVRGRFRPRPFLDLRSKVLLGDEQGLLSIAFHPAYARNRLLYVDYIDRANRTRIVEYRASRDGLSALPQTARVLFTVKQPGAQHKGGQLAFGPDGRLYFSLGDGECCDDPENRAQDLAQPFGKLFRLSTAARGSKPELVAYGLRNAWRFSFDRANGDLYIGDVGAGLREEVDFVPRAELGQLANFGWDAWEGHEVKEDKPTNAQGRLVFPVYEYSHENDNCSITGGFVYRGSAVPAARGRYFFGDYCTGAIWSLRMAGGAATDVRREASTLRGLSSFGEDARGELYALTIDGGVFRLAR